MNAGQRARVEEAQRVLAALGLPREQQNERSALTLLALLALKHTDAWRAARAPLIGVTPIMEFASKYYAAGYAPNTRETFRRHTLHQFVEAGLVVANPDKPSRPPNSPAYCYQIEATALDLLGQHGTPTWDDALKAYLATVDTLIARYDQMRDLVRIPLRVGARPISLSPGGQNPLVAKVILEFCPRFTPGGRVLYLGDTSAKWTHYEAEQLGMLGVHVDEHGKIPDIIVHMPDRNWLVLIEAVTSHGPISPKRRAELQRLFGGSTAGLVYLTAFLDRRTLLKYLADIAWETEVWVAEDPDHMIHFNGARFLGPY